MRVVPHKPLTAVKQSLLISAWPAWSPRYQLYTTLRACTVKSFDHSKRDGRELTFQQHIQYLCCSLADAKPLAYLSNSFIAFVAGVIRPIGLLAEILCEVLKLRRELARRCRALLSAASLPSTACALTSSCSARRRFILAVTCSTAS